MDYHTPTSPILLTQDDQLEQDLAMLRAQPVVYKAISPADQCLLLKRTTSAKRTYLSRLNQIAKLWGFELAVPDHLSLREQQALARERYKLVPWHSVRRHHVVWLLHLLRTTPLDDRSGNPRFEDGDLSRPITASFQTINVTLAAVKDVAKQAFLLNQLSAEELKRIEEVHGERGFRRPAGRHVPVGEIKAVIRACEEDATPAGCRDAAIIGLLYTCGLRRFEVAELQISNLSLEDGEIELKGKGNKSRISWPDKGTWHAIKDWLKQRGDHEGPLFYPVNKSGRVVIQTHLTDQSVYNVITKRVKQAALSVGASPHDFRRSFVTVLLDHGKDINTVRNMAGHSSVDTTALYDRRPELEMKKAQEVMHLPYRGSSN